MQDYIEKTKKKKKKEDKKYKGKSVRKYLNNNYEIINLKKLKAFRLSMMT